MRVTHDRAIQRDTASTSGVDAIVAHPNRVIALGLREVLGAGAVVVEGLDAALDTASAVAEGAVLVCHEGLHPDGAGAFLVDELRQRGRTNPVVTLVTPGDVGATPWGFARAAVADTDDGTEIVRAVGIAGLGGNYIDDVLASGLAALEPDTSRQPLSMRERQVLDALGAGRQNKEIAVQLGISTETVKSHVSQIMARLGVTTRAGAVAAGFRQGLLGAPTSGQQFDVLASTSILGPGARGHCVAFHQLASLVLRRVTDAVDIGMWMVTEVDGGRWVMIRTRGSGFAIKDGDVERWSDTLCSRMVEGRGPRVAPDVGEIEAYATAPIVHRQDIRCYAGVPIHADDGGLYGTLCGIGRQTALPLADHAPMLERYARLLGAVSEGAATGGRPAGRSPMPEMSM